jgi:signal transduction histidine kinase
MERKTQGSSLFSRLATSNALLAAIVVMLAVIFFHAMRGDIFEEAFQSPLEDWTATISRHIDGNPEMASRVASTHGITVIMSTSEGLVAFGPDGTSVDPAPLVQHRGDFRRINVLGQGEHSYSFLLRQDEFDQSSPYLLIGLVVLLVCTIGLVYAVQRSLLRPLGWLRGGVEAVSQGDFSVRVPVARNDEIGKVARSFNLMAQRVEEMLEDRERMLADVSHELRSPIARTKVALELLPESDKRDSIMQDVGEMESLITALLEREQVRHQSARPESEQVNLPDIAATVAAGFDTRAPGIEFSEPTESLEMRADPALLKVLLHNLLDNALKFSLPDSAPVILQLESHEGGLRIVIDDDGPGIPETKREKVLEPFVKLNPARGHHSGYGLGLNLCLRIVKALGGRITIRSKPGRGTRVQVDLPVD